MCIRDSFDHIQRVQGKITHRPLRKVSPLAVPVILEIGRERVDGLASDDLLAEAENEIISEAMNAAID